jgi:ribosome-binding factor A
VKVSPDLQMARVYYTTLGDESARRETAKALERATGFLRRHVGERLELRRVPELKFQFEESEMHQDRVEQILRDLHAEEEQRKAATVTPPPDSPSEPEHD